MVIKLVTSTVMWWVADLWFHFGLYSQDFFSETSTLLCYWIDILPNLWKFTWINGIDCGP